jgi:hypothetical protein
MVTGSPVITLDPHPRMRVPTKEGAGSKGMLDADGEKPPVYRLAVRGEEMHQEWSATDRRQWCR